MDKLSDFTDQVAVITEAVAAEIEAVGRKAIPGRRR